MKDIYMERNKLKRYSTRLKSLKFDRYCSKDDSIRMTNEHDIIYNKYKFYDEFLKARNDKTLTKKYN